MRSARRSIQALLLLTLFALVASVDLPHKSYTIRQISSVAQLEEVLGFKINNTLPTEIGYLTKLTSLQLESQGLGGRIPKEIGQLERLEELNLKNNALEGPIPDEIGGLRLLKKLSLNKNSLSGAVPATVGQLRNLETLFLHINQLTSIPEEIGDLSGRLTALKLNDNLIENLPERFYELEELRFLSLSRNRLVSLGEGLSRFKFLRSLWVRGNQLASLPDSLGELKLLDEISCSDNKLETLPSSIGELSRLQKIDISDNLLSDLPRGFSKLTQLKTVELGENRLNATAVQRTLEPLKGLTRLGLSGNSELGPKFPNFVFGLSALTSLSLSQAKLDEVPFELGNQMSELRELDLSYNEIGFLRGKFFQGLFKSLEMLDLSANKIERLSERLYAMPRLKWLAVSHNRLTHLPEDIGLLSSLTRLDVSNNRLTEVPPDVGYKLKRLQILDMHNNPFVCDRRVSEWYTPLEEAVEFHDLQIDNADHMLCSDENEFAGQPVHRVRFSDDEPETHPQYLIAKEQSATSIALTWKYKAYDQNPDDPYENESGDDDDDDAKPKNRRLARRSLQGPPANQLGRRVESSTRDTSPDHGGKDDDDYEEYGDGNDMYRPLDDLWPCDTLGYKVSTEPFSDPKVAFQVHVSRTSITAAGNGTGVPMDDSIHLCTWARQNVVVRGLAPNEVYSVRVRAINVRWDLPEIIGLEQISVFQPRLSSGPMSSTVLVQTKQSTPDGPPLMLEQLDSKESEVTMSWQVPLVTNGKVTQYELQQVVKVNDTYFEQSVPPKAEFFDITQGTIKKLAKGSRLWFRCRAYTVAGPGPWSAAVQVETMPGCLPGYQRQDTPYSCVPTCPEGAYIDNSKSGGLCTRCPSDFPRTLNPGGPGESLLDCVVDRGYFQLNDAEGRRIPGERRNCQEIEGLLCDEPGLTVATISLEPGFWRVGPASLDIRRCLHENSCTSTRRDSELANVEEQDLGGNSTETADLAGRTSAEEALLVNPQPGSAFSDLYCSENNRGVLCVMCDEGYAIEATDGVCTECSESSVERDVWMIVMWTLFCFATAALPACWVAIQARKGSKRNNQKGKDLPSSASASASAGKKSKLRSLSRASSSSRRSLIAFSRASSSTLVASASKSLAKSGLPKWERHKAQGFAVQFRIALGFYQVFAQYVLTVGTASGDNWAILAAFGDLDIASMFEAMRVDCLVKINYYGSLLVYTMYPFVCFALLGLVLVLYVRPWHSSRLPAATAEALWLLLQILFCVYPGLSSRIFRTFLYDEMPASQDELEPYVALRADYSIDYSSDASRMWRIYASFMIVVYPVGVVALFLTLTHFHHVMRQQEKLKQPLSESRILIMRAISFLPRPYTMAWFESYELVRKLVLTSVFILLFQLSNDGAKIFFVFASAFFLWVLKTVRPYRATWDHVLAEGSLALVFLLGLVPFLPTTDTSADITGELAIAIAALEAMLFIFTATMKLRSDGGSSFDSNPDNMSHHDTGASTSSHSLDSVSSSNSSQADFESYPESQPDLISPATISPKVLQNPGQEAAQWPNISFRAKSDEINSLSERRCFKLGPLTLSTPKAKDFAESNALPTTPLPATPLQGTPRPSRPAPALSPTLQNRSPRKSPCSPHQVSPAALSQSNLSMTNM